MIEIKNSLVAAAQRLGDYQAKSEDELASGVCTATENHNELLRDSYFSALVLRFWYHIERIFQKCKNINGFTREDALTVLMDCIQTACEYRGWEDLTKNLNAQQCINQVISTRGAPAVIYNANLAKNIIHSNLWSLDEPISSTDDSENTLLDMLEDSDSDFKKSAADLRVISFIQSYIDSNKLVEAIILDTIAFNDFDKTRKSVISTISENGEIVKRDQFTHEFWTRKCVQALSCLPEDYIKYFSKKYRIHSKSFEAALGSIRKASNAKLYKYIEATQQTAKADLV